VLICYQGAVTRALGPRVNTIRGIDISENMVKSYNEAAQSTGLSHEQANAVVGNLLADTVPEHLQGEEYHNFDLAVICAGFHHFENPPLAVERLTERLKPGTGVLLIVDFVPFDDEVEKERQYRKDHPEADFPDMTHTIKHNGFDEETMKRMYEQNGLVDFAWDVLPEPAVMHLKKGTVQRTIFFAKARRPA
jgi:SAM-dependent methyltransferase